MKKSRRAFDHTPSFGKMKRLSLHIAAALLTCLAGVFTATVLNPHYYKPSHLERVRLPEFFYIETHKFGRISHGIDEKILNPLRLRPSSGSPLLKTSNTQDSN
ncbi:MAG TPA: hypothetical protein VF528_16050 [Pyrinomonadaceae bacterium]